MTESIYLPPNGKTNQEIQFDFNKPIRFKHRRFYILISLDNYTRWPAACICEASTRKTANDFVEQNRYVKRLPQTIRTDEGTAFTAKELRILQISKQIINLPNTVYQHTNRIGEEVLEH